LIVQLSRPHGEPPKFDYVASDEEFLTSKGDGRLETPRKFGSFI